MKDTDPTTQLFYLENFDKIKEIFKTTKEFSFNFSCPYDKYGLLKIFYPYLEIEEVDDFISVSSGDKKLTLVEACATVFVIENLTGEKCYIFNTLSYDKQSVKEKEEQMVYYDLRD